MGLNGEIFSMIVGAFLAGVVGIATVYFAKYVEEKRTKRHTYKALFSEVTVNQDRLKRLTQKNSEVKIASKSAINLLKTEGSLKDILLKQKMSFDRTLYSALADKIGLLDSKSGENLILYYGDLEFLEHIVKLFHEKESTEEFRNAVKQGYFKSAEVTYKRGEKLIKNLKEGFITKMGPKK